MTLTLNFQGQKLNLPYLNQKWTDCHEMESKHIDWILGIKLQSLQTLTVDFQGQTSK